LAFFKEKLTNEPGDLFPNLALLSHASPFGVIYEKVRLVDMA
jgi:hypothetical protein